MIEPEIDSSADAPTQRSVSTLQVTFIGDEENGSYPHLVEGSDEEIEALVAEMEASGELSVEKSGANVQTIAEFRADNAHYFAQPETD